MTVYGTSWSHLYSFRTIRQFSELLHHTYTLFEKCDSIRNFLITHVLFSKYLTVFGTSWSHLYCFRSIWQYLELLDHTCKLFEISDSIRWRNMSIVLWRVAQIHADFWKLRPGLNPVLFRVGFVVVKKVALRQVILWALRLSPVSIVPVCSIQICHRQCVLFTSFQPLWNTFLEKKILLYFEYVGTAVVCYRILIMRQHFRLVFMCVTVLCTGGCPIWKN